MRHFRYSAPAVLYGLLAVVLGSGLLWAAGSKSSNAANRPTPVTPVKAPAGKEVATLAAGCFWSMEAIFKQLKGVEKIEPGYAGGTLARPSYEQVETGTTGHAEAVQITFDPKTITYSQLVQVLLTTRNPTTLNEQPPDAGTEYRSAIFYHTPEQQQAAKKVMQQIAAQHLWKDPIVTTVLPFKNFYRAEDYHLDYYRLHPTEPYCASVIAPEIANFRTQFKALLKP